MFMDKYNPDATPFTKNPEKYIKYSVADVQRIISEGLFENKDKDALAGSKPVPTPFKSQGSGISIGQS